MQTVAKLEVEPYESARGRPARPVAQIPDIKAQNEFCECNLSWIHASIHAASGDKLSLGLFAGPYPYLDLGQPFG